jgi:hypothetical protein
MADLSAWGRFQEIIADATRRLQAGEVDAEGFIAVLERQSFTRAEAIAEVRAIGEEENA